MQTNSKVMEVIGKPGQVWGQVIVPSHGTIEARIVGDCLQAVTMSGFGKETSLTRIQNIDSVEIAEAPNSLLLSIGAPFLLMGLLSLETSIVLGFVVLVIGAIFVFFAFREKRRLLVIHSLRYTIAIFMTKSPDLYQQFAHNVMAMARQLNAPMPAPQPQRPLSARSSNGVNGATPRSTMPH